MDELSEEQAEGLRVRLVALVGELERALQASESSAKPEAPFCVECQRGFQDG